MARDIEIPTGGNVTQLRLLGDAASSDEAAELIRRNREKDFDRRLADNEHDWRAWTARQPTRKLCARLGIKRRSLR